MFAERMLGHKLFTNQTGPRGKICNEVYICERVYARREFYIALLYDRSYQVNEKKKLIGFRVEFIYCLLPLLL
jgi:succinyl-CoA synthetase beta subunit